MTWMNEGPRERLVTTRDGTARRRVAEHTWVQCSGCRTTLYVRELELNQQVCPRCAHHNSISARHRLAVLLEHSTEIGAGVKARDALTFRDSQRYTERLDAARSASQESDAIVAQTGWLRGDEVSIACFEYAFMGGSMGSVVGERFALAVEAACDLNVPFICFAASGGARMQEGVFSLMQMGKTAASVATLRRAGLPFISGRVGKSRSFRESGGVMSTVLLGFERSAHRLETEVRSLGNLQASQNLDLSHELAGLQAKIAEGWRHTYEGLTAWQIAQVSRHPKRPYTLDYIGALCVDFVELHGDRLGADYAAIVGGLARFEGQPVVVLGHQKVRSVQERTRRNFGLPRPEGYRKAMRLMQLAERFNLPLISFVDTPGAYPGIDAEERGQSAAIGESIYMMSQLNLSTVAIVIGEGGSGGALVIGIADAVCMLQYATFSVISPEGCAAILWKDARATETAANALGITASVLKSLGLVDEAVEEPTGGAHRDPAKAAEYVRRSLHNTLGRLGAMSPEARLARRQQRLRVCGALEAASTAGSSG